MKRFLHLVLLEDKDVYLYKDIGMIPYAMGKYCNYDSYLAWFSNSNIKSISSDYKKNCNIIDLGKYSDKYSNIKTVKKFLKDNISKYEVIMLFNYGSTNYKIAYWCKKYNPNIKVFIKLDMSESGFSHFYEKNYIRRIKNYFERIKSKYVDFFTVENKYYCEKLNETLMFKNRIFYLPNGVSDLDININDFDNIEKENILITVGRMGTYEKNSKLLLQSLKGMDKQLISNWKIYLVGTMTDEFKEYFKKFIRENVFFQERIVYLGEIKERKNLYELYARSKIIGMTSLSESFGIATIEGMYFGAYPIITNYGFVVEDITNSGMFGTIVINNDVDDFISKLEIFINNSGNNRIYSECKKYARETFNYENISKLLNGYLNMI